MRAADVDAALERVVDPCSAAAGTPLSVTAMGLVRRVEVTGSRVEVDLCTTGPGCTFVGKIATAVEDELRAVPGVRDVRLGVDHVAAWDPSWLRADAAAALDAARQRAVVHLGLRPRMWQEAG